MLTVPDEVLQKLAQLYYAAKRKQPAPDAGLPLWISNINDMEMIDVEHETRDTIRACKDLKRKFGIMQHEGDRIVQGRTRREQVTEDIRREWTLQSYYLFALFLRSGVEVSEEEFDEVIREETGQKTNITNLSSRA
jgi:hypothetical protein